MSGYFELVDAPDGGYRIRMLDGTGALMAISITFPTKKAAVAGIAKAREIAGTGLVRDRSHDQQSTPVKQQSPKQHVKAARKSTPVGGRGQLIATGRRAGMGH
ncbi:hypothetical protein [Arthrobacter sp.]|uniref:YegP family protein n=1 Tax=Arthrobacter sp. TaxID=1667 RepID=UPI002810D062|nr:hypothetical protein [Arthrobacter sp.]